MTEGSVGSILIKLGSAKVLVELNDSETARSICEALPITTRNSTWGGEEIYFSIPVQADLEDGREVVDLGDIGYWPPGNASCIFSDPPRPAAGTRFASQVP